MEAETVDTSGWPEFVMVRSDHLRVKKVEHEVVEWEASFCSEDAIDVPDLIKAQEADIAIYAVVNNALEIVVAEQAAEIERLTAEVGRYRKDPLWNIKEGENAQLLFEDTP